MSDAPFQKALSPKPEFSGDLSGVDGKTAPIVGETAGSAGKPALECLFVRMERTAA